MTVYEVYEAISKSKNTNSSGKDGISMRILKDTQQFSARVITHMFNTIIFKKKYPSILKKAKVIPICKPGKPETEISSYRPISILPTVDKVLQGLMRTQLESYFEGNKIITPEHHGGRQHHSTVSALGSIDLTNKTFKEKHKTVAIMTTDLSSAFDLVDHKLLVAKLKYYGVENSAADLLSDFLSNRSMFTQIQGFNSKTIEMCPSSVIQGSRLMGFYIQSFQ